MSEHRSISVAEALRHFRTPAAMAAVALLFFFAGDWVHSRYGVDRAPAQPIEFSHALHAGEHEIPCMQCHVYAERTPVAGAPPVSKCMDCHANIDTESDELDKLEAYWEAGEPIEWVKVYSVPDFVHFTHKRHVRAGLACQDCHGPVETMERVERVNDPLMNWCVDCHVVHEVEHGKDCWTCHK